MSQTRQRQSILIVDDAIENLKMLSGLLRADYQTYIAKDGEKALELARTNPPDLILLDIVMPGMDGYEVCRRLKADSLTSDIPVVFVTAMQATEDEMHGLEIGAIDFIVKPYRAAIVKARIKNHLALQRAHAKTTLLLDNSGQGFLSFGRDLIVEPEYSRECLHLFGRPIEGLSIVELLAPEESEQQASLQKNFLRVLDETDSYKRQLRISLLKKAFDLGGVFVKAEYKVIQHGLMLILTDVTERRELESKIERERNRLRLVVTAVQEYQGFFDLLEDFETFCARGIPALLARSDQQPDTLNKAYRSLHTFKGLFGQYGFLEVPKILHRAESRLVSMQKHPDSLADDFRAFLSSFDASSILNQDMALIEEFLGQEFLSRRGELVIGREHAQRIEAKAESLLHMALDKGLGREMLDLLQDIRAIRRVNFKALLASYPRYALELAERLGKEIQPFEVQGEDIPIDPELYAPFTKSLIHVFRNAVDHGLESPDERLACGKDERGSLACVVKRDLNGLIVTVSDDGRGIDVDRLKAIAVERHVCTPEAAAKTSDLDACQLIFAMDVSTRESATDLSGRGVGLSAVKAEVDRLGGRIDIDSTPGQGMTIRFSLPLRENAQATQAPPAG